MEKYISAEAAAEAFRQLIIASGKPQGIYHERTYLDGIAESRNAIRDIPAADVVSRDCYDRILAENDTMREMLAQIGKKPGDEICDMVKVVRCKDCRFWDKENLCGVWNDYVYNDHFFCASGSRRANNG